MLADRSVDVQVSLPELMNPADSASAGGDRRQAMYGSRTSCRAVGLPFERAVAAKQSLRHCSSLQNRVIRELLRAEM